MTNLQKTAANDEEKDRLQQRLFDRYGYGLPTNARWNETLDGLLAHRSVRAYTLEPVANDIIEMALAAAQSAASSSNLQPWSVIAVQNPARKKRLAALAGHQKHIEQAPLLLLWLIDHRRLSDIGDSVGISADALDYLESFLVGAVDTTLAAQNATIAFETHGLGTCYIGGIRNKPLEVAEELGLPSQVFALFGLTVGYPDPATPAAVKPRLPHQSVLFHERYRQSDRSADLDAYNQRLRTFQQQQAMIETDWTEQIAQRLRGPEAMAGRHSLSDTLKAQGFKIR